MRAKPIPMGHANGAGTRRAPVPSPDTSTRLAFLPSSVPPGLLATIAHEFRTPIAAMLVTLEMLEDASSMSSDDSAHLMRRLRRSVNWLNSLLDNLRTLAAVEDGQLMPNWAPVSIVDCGELARALVLPFLERRNQRVSVAYPTPSPVVRGDSRLLCQALVNLLTNASQYGSGDDVIELTVSPAPDWVTIRVTDNGPGIPEHEQEHIFDRYVRGDAATRERPEGLGLGLHIVKAIVEMHQGIVGVDSIPGSGASFWLRLPMGQLSGH